MKNEIWKTIPGYTLYEASNMGRLKTYNWKGTGREAIMKPALDGSGYLRTMLKRDIDGKIHTVKVHRIIASTFIDNPENKPEVNHKNGIRTDNRLENLEWLTHSENIKDSFTSGRSCNKGDDNPTSKLTSEQVLEIRRLYVRGHKNQHDLKYTKADLANMFGVKYGTIKQIIQRKTWNHL